MIGIKNFLWENARPKTSPKFQETPKAPHIGDAGLHIIVLDWPFKISLNWIYGQKLDDMHFAVSVQGFHSIGGSLDSPSQCHLRHGLAKTI